MIKQYDKGALIKIELVFQPVYHVAYRGVVSNGSFNTFILARLSGSVISEIHKLWGSPVFWKCSKFNADLKIEEKKSEKIFCFWDKCTWIVCVEFCLLTTEYLSSAVNVLTKSLKPFHVTKSDFCDSISFTVISQYDKGAGVKIESVFRPVYRVTCRGVLSNGRF